MQLCCEPLVGWRTRVFPGLKKSFVTFKLRELCGTVRCGSYRDPWSEVTGDE